MMAFFVRGGSTIGRDKRDHLRDPQRIAVEGRDAPEEYGPHRTLYNRFVRWSRRGVFERMFAGLAGEGSSRERIMIDATHLKAHRTAASLRKKGGVRAASDAPRAG
jgi:transposase